MAGTWVRIAYSVDGEGMFNFVARLDGSLEEAVLGRRPEEFVRFDFVRWLDGEDEDQDRPEFTKNEEDDESGSDHYVYLRQGRIILIEPIREAFIEFWNATISEGGALW